jgi:hypothetical protein
MKRHKDTPPVHSRSPRDQMAEAMRQLASGLITNDEFDRRYDLLPSSDEVCELYLFAWGFYNDTHTHRLRGKHRLSKLQRQVFARCALFLRSGLPYQYDRKAKWLWAKQGGSGINVFTWLLLWCNPRAVEIMAVRAERQERYGSDEVIDDRIWPFRSRADLELAKQTCHLLGR